MNMDALRQLIPAYAQDMSQNLAVLVDEDYLSDQQKWGVLLSCAHAIGVPSVVKAVEMSATQVLSPESVNAAKSAAAIMVMNNVYYRALHLMHNQEYASLPARLRMNVLGNPGVPKVDFELWSFAVSAINGCGLCMDSHEKVLRSHGVSGLQVQAALRIASVIAAISTVLRAEAATSS